MQFQSIKKLIMLIAVVVTVFSCNNGLTLQTYYVDNELKPGFQSLDIPTSFLDIEQTNLTEKQKEAYNSIDKLNMLSFVKSDDNTEEFNTELAKVKTILKNPKYEELIRGGNVSDGKFMVKFLGDVESVDELILFGYANDRGFAIVRVLGNDMNANDLVQVAMSFKDMEMDDSKVNEFMNFFK